MTTITIETKDGNVNVDPALFTAQLHEGFAYLEIIEEQQEHLKLLLETMEENHGLKKATLSKYMKARHAAATKGVKELGELFTVLDEATR